MMKNQYDSKTALPTYHKKHHEPGSPRRPITSQGRSRRSIVVFLTTFTLIFLTVSYAPSYYLSNSYILPDHEGISSDSNSTKSNRTGLVPLEAHIMSKCPDARDCLRDLVVPAMEKVVEKVDFRLSYIGTVDSNDTVQCKHGGAECLGNMLGLCANELYPNNTKISLGFSTCLIMSYQRIPDRDLVVQCALEHGVAFDNLNACISEEGKGLDLLEASVQRSEDAGVEKSCTVRVGGEEWCVRDGGKWKDCDGGHEASDLIKEVERRYKTG